MFIGAVPVLLVGTAMTFLQPAASQPNAKKVEICHATSSQKNPYVLQAPAIANNGDLKGGHLNHTGPVFPAQGWGDIIPPYTYVDAAGATKVFPGYNWSQEGQAIWQADCGPGGPEALTPFVECIEPGAAGGFLAHFGYDNPNTDPVADPPDNVFDPLLKDGEQPTVFGPGRVADAFQVTSDGGDLTWKLTGNRATASASSTHCQGSITIIKVLNPATDAGRFNLEVDGAIAGGAAKVGNGGTTGTIAVDSGQRTVGESAAAGTDLSDYDIQITCSSSTGVAAQGSGATLTVPVKLGQAIICTITNTHKLVNTITPELECVVSRAGQPNLAVWGYSNPNAFPVSVPVGETNGFSPTPADRGQPIVFQPGHLVGAFQTSFQGAATLAWTVGKKTVTADTGSTRCTATLELRKVTVPADDPGLFNLLVNNQLLAVGGNGTTTGPATVGVGEGEVSETAGPDTDLANYDSTVACTRNGSPEVSVVGTKVDGAVGNGDVVVCTFTNTRKPTAPPPTPEPPPPPPPLPQPPPPAPSLPLGDLSVVKTAAPTSAVLGKRIIWTIRVTNNSTISAADVNVVRTSDLSFRVKVISLTPSQGTCNVGSCSLGRLAPGASATITVLTQATSIGRALNVVRVSSEEQESNYLNNTASALVRITAPKKQSVARAIKGAVARFTCNTLTAQPAALRARTTSIVLATARNRFRQPLAGVAVQVAGLGVDQRGRTNRQGIVRFSVTPQRIGVVSIERVGRSLDGIAPQCRTLLGALSSGKNSVTG